MEINCVSDDMAAIMTPHGRLDGRYSSILKKKIAEQLRQNSRIIIDMSQVSFIDSTGLGVLVGALKKAISREGDIRLVSPTEEVRMLMELTRVDRVFLVYSNQELALKSYSEN
jgi:anti-sigma B factor antagonist